ncbi:MAG TPA: hypothetical protein DCS07_06225 [Bdellovibrionales bacterium]|nr:MAG: hypothetical protein A2Z97_13240 [Bdellovibrionales bacterium GWB1_52_6]OFZ05797.1 MAG: hypothetical protein A2X97_03790 [Bdellovibrionales bacterium GWA1_52_35]OFZ43675.1 MAG: hypothetical protein A2070_02630 [Bdellovibrionales bacterium GWC1_52_8]HAR42213.1 hypothetical protein [Bdellovibrionales bacterium]HCM40262.1 hypothetical protein [Bdellovibrionales bacterium]
MKLFAMIAMLAFSMVAFAEEPAEQVAAPDAIATEQVAPAPTAEKKVKKVKKTKKTKKAKKVQKIEAEATPAAHQ